MLRKRRVEPFCPIVFGREDRSVRKKSNIQRKESNILRPREVPASISERRV